MQWNRHDYRIDSEDPPLWQYWASLPNGPNALKADVTGPIWKSMPQMVARQWYWGVVTLYRTPGNDPVSFTNRCRVMMLILSVGLGVLMASWSWQLGGAVAAVVATLMFTLDPNFLAHASLMKNDVVFAFALLLLSWALWKGGQKLTLFNTGLISLSCAVILTVKFSGLVSVLLVPAMLGVRAVLSDQWTVIGRNVSSRFNRLGVAIAVSGFCAVISYTGIWAVYGFRFRPTPEKNVWLNMDELADRGNTNRIAAAFDGHPPPDAFAHAEPSPTVQAVLFANRHGLLPQAYLAGFLFTYDAALIRPSYLCGEISMVGWWWYFPFTILVKTPVATLIAMGATLAFAIKSLIARARMPGIEQPNKPTANAIRGLPPAAIKEPQNWTILCLAVPFAILLISAMFSHLNIGIRHVLGLFPLVFISIGWAVSRVWSNRKSRVIASILLVGLGVESLSAYPNFIPFFNLIGNAEGGINLLGDSNLDWGQDLPLLQKWQHEHPKEKLYLSYFGYADPVYYGIRYVPLPGGYHYDPKPEFPDPYSRYVTAISASNLQGVLVDPRLMDFYNGWRKQKPIAVLGGSIYLYQHEPGAE